MHADILFYERWEAQLKKDGQTFEKLGVDIEKRKMFSKNIGRSYWVLGEELKSGDVDEYVKQMF